MGQRHSVCSPVVGLVSFQGYHCCVTFLLKNPSSLPFLGSTSSSKYRSHFHAQKPSSIPCILCKFHRSPLSSSLTREPRLADTSSPFWTMPLRSFRLRDAASSIPSLPSATCTQLGLLHASRPSCCNVASLAMTYTPGSVLPFDKKEKSFFKILTPHSTLTHQFLRPNLHILPCTSQSSTYLVFRLKKKKRPLQATQFE